MSWLLLVPTTLAQAAPQAMPIGFAGWVFMVGSVGAVTTLVVWCFRRVLGRSPAGRD